MVFDLPIELFFLGCLLPILFTVIGLISKPRIHWLIIATGMFISIFSLATDNMIMGYRSEIDDQVTIVWDQQVLTGQAPIHNGTSNIVVRSEQVVNSASMLLGDTVNCMEIAIARTGSPPITTPVILGVYSGTVSSSIAETKYEFGRINVTNITLEKTFFKRCNTDSDYTFVVGDRIGVMYRAGDASNFIAINLSTQNPFDGTNSHEGTFNDATNVWQTSTVNDLAQVTLTLENDPTVTNTEIHYEFTELVKTLFVLMGGFICITSVFMIRNEP